jgi:hypothetical protein
VRRQKGKSKGAVRVCPAVSTKVGNGHWKSQCKGMATGPVSGQNGRFPYCFTNVSRGKNYLENRVLRVRLRLKPACTHGIVSN